MAMKMFNSCSNPLRKGLILIALLLSTGAFAQLTINTSVTASQLVSSLLGGGLNVTNINLNCTSGAYGTFSNGNTTNLGVSNGILLTTGAATNAVGPNNSPSLGTCNGTSASDPQLTTIEPLATQDPCILEFDLVPTCNNLQIRFVFGSEEYPEFVSSGFNDAFGFFITGPGGPSCTANYFNNTNIATLPNNTTIVTIDNVNNVTNSAYYVDNTSGATIQYDGFTTVLTRNVTLCPCQSYHFKLAIADAGDCNYDSGVFVDFLQCSTALTVASTFTPVSSCSACDGTATVTATGGNPSYSYSWAPTGGNAATATGLCPGTYTCTVTDQGGCTAPQTAVVTIPGPGVVTASLSSQVNVSCNGGNNGSATVTGSGGSGTYTYSWAPSGGNASTATNLPAGTYTVTVNDANGCSATQNVTITQPPALTASISATPSACLANSGSATVTVSGGTGSYTYSWAPSGGNAATASNLAGGTYTCTITDSNGCTNTQTVTVAQTGGVSSTSTASSITCFGNNNGTATVTATGGSGTYTYSWSPSGGNAATATNLSAGTYTCDITDSNGCTSQQVVTITEPPAITATSTSSDVTCNGNANGSATVTASGGSGTLSYSWAPSGGNAATASNLGPGNYTCTITDANGCSATASAVITEPAVLNAGVIVAPIGCNPTTSATANVTGGTGPYQYTWSSGGNAQTENNLGAGTYTLTVTDANGCALTTQFNVTPSSSMTTSATSSNASCFNSNDGSATVTPSGGNPPYTYSWSPTGGNNSTATGLAPGTYTCTITDSNGCTTTQTVTITQPTQVTSTGTGGSVSCFGGTNGSASVTASGGSGTFTYSWLPSGGSGSSASSLSAGTYTVLITDANGCSTSQTVQITQPTQLVASATGDISCEGNSSTISASAAGGNGPYTYAWSNGPATASQTVNPSQTTTYTVVVTDANGCSDSETATVTVNPLPPATITSNAINGIFQASATGADLCFSGPAGVSTWTWNLNGTGTSAIQDPCVTLTSANTGTYCVSLVTTSTAGCISADTLCVDVMLSSYSIPNVFTPNGDGSNDFFVISNEGMKSLHCQIYDRWGVLVYEWDGTTGAWDGKTNNGKLAVDGVYYFTAHLVDIADKVYDESGFVHLITGNN